MLYKRKILTLPEGVVHRPRYINDMREYSIEQASVETIVKTPSGAVTASVDDYILTDSACSEKWVCKPADFNNVFENV